MKLFKRIFYFLITYILIAFLNTSCEVNRETTLNESVFILGQTELDNFTNNNYQIINGSLEISSSDTDPVLSLSALSDLQEINGNLTIKFTEIETLQGLQNLRKVSNLNIHNNSNLQNIDGLSSLEEGLQIISIYENPTLSLIDLDFPLSTFTSIRINNNPQLSLILENNQIVSIEAELEIANNPNLQNINGFNSLTTVNGIFSIEGNDSLVELSIPQLSYANRFNLRSSSLESANFVSLEIVNITFDLWETQLENFSSFSSLTSLGGRFTIIQNSSLTDWCDITPLLLSEDFNFGPQYFITSNGYNPSPQDLENGDCSI